MLYVYVLARPKNIKKKISYYLGIMLVRIDKNELQVKHYWLCFMLNWRLKLLLQILYHPSKLLCVVCFAVERMYTYLCVYLAIILDIWHNMFNFWLGSAGSPTSGSGLMRWSGPMRSSVQTAAMLNKVNAGYQMFSKLLVKNI